jgi:hypothetical protein
MASLYELVGMGAEVLATLEAGQKRAPVSQTVPLRRPLEPVKQNSAAREKADEHESGNGCEWRRPD